MQLEKVAIWQRLDGGVSITYFDQRDMQKYGFTDEDAFIVWQVNRLKPSFGVDPTIATKADIPPDSPDRDCWEFKGGKVKIDAQKKAAKQAKEAEKDTIFAKLGITADEFRKIRTKL